MLGVLWRLLAVVQLVQPFAAVLAVVPLLSIELTLTSAEIMALFISARHAHS